jgi:hypothetical protein
LEGWKGWRGWCVSNREGFRRVRVGKKRKKKKKERIKEALEKIDLHRIPGRWSKIEAAKLINDLSLITN